MKYICLIFFLTTIFNFSSEAQNLPVEPELQFVKIHFKYFFKDELNTFENTCTKDLVMDGVIKTDFWLTSKEQKDILKMAKKSKFFSMPDTFKYVSKGNIGVSYSLDLGPQMLRIKYKTKDKTVVWTYPTTEGDVRAQKLIKLSRSIRKIIEAKPEYKKLPRPREAYL